MRSEHAHSGMLFSSRFMSIFDNYSISVSTVNSGIPNQVEIGDTRHGFQRLQIVKSSDFKNTFI